MKISYFSNVPIPSHKANSFQVMKMCHAIASLGHDVVLYARISKEETYDIFEYYGVTANFRIELNPWPKIRGLGGHLYARRVNKSCIQSGLADAFFGRDVYSLLQVSKAGIPVVFEEHTLPVNFYNKYLIEKLIKRNNFKRLIVTADALKEGYLKLYPWLDEDQICVVRNGADDPIDLEKENSERNSGATKIGYVGNVYASKGIELILQLAATMPYCEFHIVGGGNEEDFQRWKVNDNLDNIHFHGLVPNKHLHRYYSEFDIVLAPYPNQRLGRKNSATVDRYASPLKIMEYMSFKKPIIASDLPMIREVITNGENGLLCDSQNLPEWKDCIDRLIKDSSLRERLGKNAYQDFAATYTWKCRAKKVIEQFGFRDGLPVHGFEPKS